MQNSQSMEIDQGTVIHGVRSSKYGSVGCYGIIVSASCDIANKKIQNIYYLIGVDIKEWLMGEIGFHCAFNDLIGSLASDLGKKADNQDLDVELIKKMEEDDVIKIAKEEIKNEKEYKAFVCAFDEYKKFFCDSCRKSIIVEKKKHWIKFIKNIERGTNSQYYFLPQKYYTTNSKDGRGLIVDMQELYCMPLNIADEILTPGIDRRRLKSSDNETLQCWQNFFWLPNADSFVSVEGIIESPRREHLMQHFSNYFVRIGVERVSEFDYECLVDMFNT